MALSTVAQSLIRSLYGTWNNGRQQPVLVTYSFAATPDGYQGFPYSGPISGFDGQQQQAARQALDAWGSISGVKFIEVPDLPQGDGIDIRFAMADLGDEYAGYGGYPQIGDVLLNSKLYGADAMSPGSYAYFVLLHEIGHSLGLKHPFDGYPTLPERLNNHDYTVMAYAKQNYGLPFSLRAADVEAIQYLYGTQWDEEIFSIQWSWDATLGGIRHQGDGSSQTINGTVMRDIILGGDGNDTLYGKGGDDVLYGQGGRDTLYGDAGHDSLFGGDGDDWLYAGSGNDLLLGEAGADTLFGGDGDDLLSGGEGDDTLYGDAGNDVLYGDLGNDRLYGGSGNDLLAGGAGWNNVVGGEGRDTLETWLFRGETQFAQLTVGLELNYRSVSGRLVGSGEDTTFSGIETIAFGDGRLVFDDTDPVAQVARMYQAALGRLPDAVGREGWTTALMQGAPLASLAAQFLESPEFIARFGRPDDTGFILRAYEQALGRGADAQGLAYWQGQLAGGMSRAEMLTGFGESGENRNITSPLLANGLWDADDHAMQATRLYLAVLDRAPEITGLRYWTGLLDQGMSVAEAGNGFAGSYEFQTRFAAADNNSFVHVVYANTLGRAPDTSGYGFWMNQLAQGVSRGEMVAGFSESAEFIHQNAGILDHGIAFA